MEKLLITGGNGYLGKCIRDGLQGNYAIKTLGIKKTNDVVCNLANNVPDLSEGYEYIVHSAGMAHKLPKNFKEIFSYYQVNYMGVVRLLKALDTVLVRPKAIVFISTVAVYGKDKGNNINEEDTLSARDAYGRSKILAEMELNEWGRRNDVKITILRLPLIVGNNPPGNLGAMIKAIKKNRFILIGEGNVKRSMVLAKDIVGFIPIVFNVGGIYNLTDGYHPTYRELTDIIRSRLEVRRIHSIPLILAQLIALGGDIIEMMLKISFLINSNRLKKLNSSLCFDDSKARLIGWKSRKVLSYSQEWLPTK